MDTREYKAQRKFSTVTKHKDTFIIIKWTSASQESTIVIKQC